MGREPTLPSLMGFPSRTIPAEHEEFPQFSRKRKTAKWFGFSPENCNLRTFSSMAWKRSRVRISPGPPRLFKGLRPIGTPNWSFLESNRSPNPRLSMGSLGHRADSDAAHDWAFFRNAIRRMGGVGIVFHVCCLLETTTIALPIRMCPSRPTHAGRTGIRTVEENSDASDASDAAVCFEALTVWIERRTSLGLRRLASHPAGSRRVVPCGKPGRRAEPEVPQSWRPPRQRQPSSSGSKIGLVAATRRVDNV